MQKNENSLNEAQTQAAQHKDGPLLIVAGAGAGKTKTLTQRILNLIESGIPGREILAVTFTNKAAQEMRERVLSHLPNQGYGEKPFIGTFHSLGVHILREEHKTVGVLRHFTIVDQQDARSIIKNIIKSKNLDPKQFEPQKIQSIISRQKGEGVSSRTFYENSNTGFFPRLVGEVWVQYDERLAKEGAFDFDDLLLKTLQLLESNKEILQKYRSIWRYLHIDEYQDTNAVQYKLARILAGEKANICVVGDADQNIYSWRGANIRNILRFEKDFPGTTVVLLEENYRSTQNILSAANNIIEKNKLRVPKNLFTKRTDGEKISLYEAYDESAEGAFIAEKISKLETKDVPLNEIAVLFRANFQSRAIEEAMLGAGIPYQVLGVKFFDRKEVKDALSFLRAALNPQSTIDLKRIINIPPRGIGEVTVKKILEGKRDTLPPATAKKVSDFEVLLGRIRVKALASTPSETMKYLLSETGITRNLSLGGEEEEERLENLQELVTLAQKYDLLPQEEALARLLEDAALASDQDSLLHPKEKSAVRLMTVHAAKGLEFRAVFITGLEEGLFPHRRMGETSSTEEQKEEERRLFYVAITRAKEKLFLTYASARTIFGSRQINAPSAFLNDISPELLDIEISSGYGEGGGKVIYI